MLTVLRAAAPIAKVISRDANDSIKITQYPQIQYFTYREYEPKDLSGLIKVLETLTIHDCVIRGELRDNQPKIEQARNKELVRDADQQWLCIDIDAFDITPLQCTFAEAPGILKEMLPPEFSKASAYYQFSASSGFKGNKVSIHYWFWMSEPVSNQRLKTYFELFNQSYEATYGVKLVDGVLYDPIQIHYTAPPVIIGMDDPIPQRTGLVKGLTDIVTLGADILPPSDLNEDSKSVAKYLAKMGDDKDGFHGPLRSASMVFARQRERNQAAINEFKLLARDAIQQADRSRHAATQLERYSSDAYLEMLLNSAWDKQAQGEFLAPTIAAVFQDYVFLKEEAQFFNRKDGTRIGKDTFNSMMLRHFTNKKVAADIFISSGYNMAAYEMHLVGRAPGAIVEFMGTQVLNSWKGRNGTQKGEYDVTPMLDHVNYMCNGKVDEYNQLLNWMAFFIKNPGKKIMWAPILYGKQGTGKSTVKRMLASVLKTPVYEIKTDTVASNFNAFVKHEYVVIEESDSSEKRHIANILKEIITEPYLEINEKFIRQKMIPNAVNMMIFSNNDIPVLLEASDRRYLVVRSPDTPKPVEYYDSLNNWIAGGVADDLTSWAHNRDLSKFNPYVAPAMNADKKELIRRSMGKDAQDLSYALENRDWPLQHDAVFEGNVKMAANLQPRQLQPIATALDIEVIRVNGKNVWVIDRQGRTDEEMYDIANSTVVGQKNDYWNSAFRERPRPLLRIVKPEDKK